MLTNMRWLAWLALVIPAGAHTISMSTSTLEVHGTTARLEVRVPAYEVQHVANPQSAIPVAFEIQSASQTSAVCIGESSGYLCRIEFTNVSVPLQVRCRLANVIVENHVHVMHARHAGRVDQAVFDSTLQEATLRFRQAGALESAARTRPQMIGIALLVFTIGTLLVASWRAGVTGLGLLIGAIAGAIGARWMPWQLTPAFLEIATLVISAYALFELVVLPASFWRLAVSTLLGTTFGLYAAGLSGSIAVGLSAAVGVTAVATGAALKLWRARRCDKLGAIMHRFMATFLLLAGAALSATSDFNGRWDITVNEENRKRAWWLEVKGAETPNPAGSFIGAPGGGLDQLTDLKLDNGELTWSFTRGFRYGQGDQNKPRTGTYRARVVDGKLEGTLKLEGEPEPIRFAGVRAPKLKPVDASKLKAGKPIELFNGKDLTGWRPLHANRKVEWQVVDGITKNVPRAVDIVTEQKFWNFKLHAEYRVGPKSNSGIGLRGRYEVQILEDYGRDVSLHGNGALYSRILPSTNASKPANEWQTFDITLIGNHVSVVLNGTTIIDNKEIDGLTAVAIDPNEGEPGPIIIQGDHGAVEFRKLVLTPLLDD